MDSSEWELSKENVQPIKQGRKIPNLMAGLAPNGEDAHWKLQKDKRSFEAEIRTYDGEDPLDVWYRYVLWIEENIPKGGREISTLLERCINEFKDVLKYKCDERYLQVWIKYAECCSDPLDIFNYMHSQGISSVLPQFYIAWASAYENAENYNKADEILMLGMKRNVQPVEVLKKYQMGFQHRLTTRIAAKDEADELELHESFNVGRNALGLLKTTGKKKSVTALRTASVYNHQAGNTSNSLGKTQNIGRTFSVFQDPDSENRAPGLPDALGDWKEPPAQSITTKENVALPGKWTKGKRSSRSSGSSFSSVRPISKPNFQVHVEENAAQQSMCGSRVVGSQVLNSREPDSERSNDPLKGIVQDEDSTDATSKVMYDKAKVYSGTEEFQFEEIRAAKYFALTRQGRPLPADIRRFKRGQEEANHDAEEIREKAVYQKEKVYAYEGEFQPEEIMARLWHERGGRLRFKKRERSGVHQASISESTGSEKRKAISDPLVLPHETTSSRELNDRRNLPGCKSEDFVKYDHEEIPPKEERRNTDENSNDNLSQRSALCCSSENYLVERHSTSDIPSRALKEVIQLATPNQTKPDDNPRQSSVVRQKLFEQASLLPREKHVSNLAGPSPTLTTKQAFAEVMPWFNTTVGLNDSDAEFEAKFKNDPNSENNLELFGTKLGAEFDFAGFKRENTMNDDQDENQENMPPIGYTQPKFGRPNLEVLQPALGIPTEPLEERPSSDEDDYQLAEAKLTVKSESTVPPEYEKNKYHNNDEDDVTNYQGMDHLQFTRAARLASTPFEENSDLRALPTFHCSTIHPSDVIGPSEQNEEEPCSAETEPSSSSIPPASSFNTPSNGLSPILECSDEDSKKDRSHDITVHSSNGDVLRIVNPFDAEICDELLSKLSKPVNTFSGYHDLKDKGMTKIAASKAVDIGEDLYRVGKYIGSGAFAKVFSAKRLSVDLGNDDEEDTESMPLAIKVQSPANEWEFYICSVLHERLQSLGKSEKELSTLVKMDDFYVFANGSCAVTELHEKGTFLDLVNYYKGNNARLTEPIAVYYAIELMKILDCIHEVGIIHGDIKPDNLVLIGGNSDSQKERSLVLIDFGCAIDVRLFPSGTRFSVRRNTDSFECIEMKTGRPWTTQVDTYGMLGCLHCLMFGEYMKVYTDASSGRWRPIKSVTRTWNKSLWTKLFDAFLNIPSCNELPSVKAICEQFQDYFDLKLKKSFFHLKNEQDVGLHRN